MSITERKNPLTEDLVPLDAQVKSTTQPLPSEGNHSWVICGKKGTGKSTLLIRAISSKKSPWYAAKAFDNVYLCSQSAHRDDKFSDLVEELESQGRFYPTFNESILDDIVTELRHFNDQYKDDMAEFKRNKEATGKGFFTRVVGHERNGKEITKKIYKERLVPRHLIILDDVLNLLPKSTQNSKINDLYTNHRHSKLNIITTTQVYNKLSTVIRRNADMLSLFRTENAQEYDTIENDWMIGKDLFKPVWDYATKEPNDFLHIQVCGARPLFFKRFNPLEISPIPL
jgi:Cdc6-like AAA superfamily ATPase